MVRQWCCAGTRGSLALSLALAALWGVSGCAVRRTGFIEPDGARVAIVSGDGQRDRLVLVGEAGALRQLADHLVEVQGREAFGRITVGSWRAIEGPHGLGVYVGTVQRLGMQIGIADVGSGQLLVVDDAAARDLAVWLGDRVAVEGYVDGPIHLRVLYWVPLDLPPPR